jgi:hypothetical protein
MRAEGMAMQCLVGQTQRVPVGALIRPHDIDAYVRMAVSVMLPAVRRSVELQRRNEYVCEVACQKYVNWHATVHTNVHANWHVMRYTNSRELAESRRSAGVHLTCGERQ